MKIGVGSPFDINTDPANNVNEICNPIIEYPYKFFSFNIHHKWSQGVRANRLVLSWKWVQFSQVFINIF